MGKPLNDIFYGKIILFGEYGIIFDSMALTIPFTHFHGELSFNNDNDRFKYTDYDFALNSNGQLREFAENLTKLKKENLLPEDINTEEFSEDLKKGLYFESTIPQGFGLGSSGALVAAVYSRYALDRIDGGRSVTKTDILKLKDIFSAMENHFHGRSSGIDPLNSYIKFPLLITSKTQIETVGIPRNKYNGDSAIFLLNTGQPGKTGPLVNHFIQLCDNPEYFSIITDKYIPLNSVCINNLISGELNSFFFNLTRLSELQYTHFQSMIPDHVRNIWKEGLDSDTYKLKLCGSGGGGYLLGFTENLPEAQQLFRGKQIEMVTVYKSGKN
jgi:mevalonate kinase